MTKVKVEKLELLEKGLKRIGELEKKKQTRMEEKKKES